MSLRHVHNIWDYWPVIMITWGIAGMTRIGGAYGRNATSGQPGGAWEPEGIVGGGGVARANVDVGCGPEARPTEAGRFRLGGV